MARGRKPAKIASQKVVSRKRMLGDKEVFPIRVVSRREGMKYDIMGGYTREVRDTMTTIYDTDGYPIPFKKIGKLV